MRGSPQCDSVLNTNLPRDFTINKMNLDNYYGLSNPREHVRNMRSSLELLLQDSKAMCNVLPTTFQGSIRAWYHSLKPISISNFSYLCDKLIARFSTSISI